MNKRTLRASSLVANDAAHEVEALAGSSLPPCTEMQGGSYRLLAEHTYAPDLPTTEVSDGLSRIAVR